MARRIPKITAEYLERVTAWYLERHATSSAHLRRLLMRRVQRSATEHGTDPAEGETLVDLEIHRLLRLRLLDDERYAADKVRSLRRKGTSTARVRAALRAKGVAEASTEPTPGEDSDPDWTAARIWARKRKIGPWRGGPADPELRKKELGRMGRAGFSWEVARRIVEASDPEEL